MKRVILSMLAVATLAFTSCSDDDDQGQDQPQELVIPATYNFKNVSFSGQVTRLKMAAELKTALGKDGLETTDLSKLIKMFKDGEGFSDASLKGKQLRKTVASATFSTLSSVEGDGLRKKMDGWLKEFANIVIPAKDVDAKKGVAGNLEAKRYVNAKGIEANQAVAKTLIGALILDQVVNKYVSKGYLDANKAAHEAGTPYKEGKTYTALEHGWDEAYGYIFGTDDKPLAPTLDSGNSFLGKYLKKVAKTKSGKFKTIFDDVYKAFRTGRAAIGAKNYKVMHEQAAILRTELSKVVGVKATYYLLKGQGEKNASTLHALSEAYGFAHALMFAHITSPVKGQAGASAKPLIEALEKGENGLWSLEDENLKALATKVAGYFGFAPEDVL